MSISQIPSGWTITRSDERIVVQHASGSFYAAAKEGDSGIAESILYMLANSLLSATLSPAHIEDGEEVEVVGTLIIGEQGWDNAIELNPDPVMALADAHPKSSMPLMTVAQHQRIVAARASKAAAHIEDEREAFEASYCAELEMRGGRIDRAVFTRDAVGDYIVPGVQSAWWAWQARAALPAPPAAGVPEGYVLAPIKPTIEMVAAGYEASLGQPDRSAHARVIEQYDAMLAEAPTPPASEQQRAVVMPERLREAMGKAASSWLYENDPQGLDWCDPRNVDALLDALFEAAPHLAKGEGV